MNWTSILWSILGIIITALISKAISKASEVVISYINSKVKNAKCANLLTSAVGVVTQAVKSTYQTFVEGLKQKDAFTKEKQAEALNIAKTSIVSQLTQETKEYIEQELGGVDNWVVSTIESTLYDLKK